MSKHLCPRRGENPGPWSFVPEEDGWDERDGRLHCSYCGSLAPELFMEAVENGHAVGPTDKGYKAYIEFADPLYGQRVQVGSSSGPTHDREGRPNQPDLTPEEIAAGRYDRPLFGNAGPVKTEKFYYMHLSSSQKMRFVELLNEKRMNIGPPGHFYVLPYFLGRGEK